MKDTHKRERVCVCVCEEKEKRKRAKRSNLAVHNRANIFRLLSLLENAAAHNVGPCFFWRGAKKEAALLALRLGPGHAVGLEQSLDGVTSLEGDLHTLALRDHLQGQVSLRPHHRLGDAHAQELLAALSKGLRSIFIEGVVKREEGHKNGEG